MAGVGAVAVVAALGLVLLPVHRPGAPDEVDDDAVALPTSAATPPAAPTTAPATVRCTRAGEVVGCRMWEVDTGEAISMGPRLPGTDVLVDRRPDTLTVRDPDTGEVRWQRDDLGDGVPLAVVDGVLVLGGREQPVRGIDLDDGGVRWSAPGLHGVGAPRLAPDVVVLGRREPGTIEATSLVGLDPRSGDVRWEWRTPWRGTVESAVQPAGRTGVLATGGGRLARVDTATGQATWVVDTLPGAYLQAHASGYASAQQLANGAQPRLWVHDLATGAVVQRMPAARIAAHAVLDEVVVVHAPSEGVVRGMDLATGERLWQVLLDSAGALGFAVTPADEGAAVVLERDAGRVTRIDPATGEPVWTATLEPAASAVEATTFFGHPMLVDDVVVVEDTSSVITVLDADTGQERLRVAGTPQLDVRSLTPLTLVDGTHWMRVRIPRVSSASASGPTPSRRTPPAPLPTAPARPGWRGR